MIIVLKLIIKRFLTTFLALIYKTEVILPISDGRDLSLSLIL